LGLPPAATDQTTTADVIRAPRGAAAGGFNLLEGTGEQRRASAALEVVYAPIGYAMDKRVPGSDAYLAYMVWCSEALGVEVEI